MTDLGQRFLACFVQAADDARLPGDPEFRRALRSYMEWAVSEVLQYGDAGSVVPGDLAMPRWGWEGPEPQRVRHSRSGPDAGPAVEET